MSAMELSELNATNNPNVIVNGDTTVHATMVSMTTKSRSGRDPNLCQYSGKRCPNMRAVKRNGALHTMCELHRAKANKNQRRLEIKKRERQEMRKSARQVIETTQNSLVQQKKLLASKAALWKTNASAKSREDLCSDMGEWIDIVDIFDPISAATLATSAHEQHELSIDVDSQSTTTNTEVEAALKSLDLEQVTRFQEEQFDHDDGHEQVAPGALLADAFSTNPSRLVVPSPDAFNALTLSPEGANSPCTPDTFDASVGCAFVVDPFQKGAVTVQLRPVPEPVKFTGQFATSTTWAPEELFILSNCLF